MRILQVSSARAFGGGERHLADLARGLSARGHELFVALAEGSPLRERLTFLPEQNVFTLPLRNALDLSGAAKLSRLAREKGVDVLHAHVARDYTLAAFAARRAKARLVVTRHVMFPLSRVHRLALSNVSRVIAVSGAVARALRAQRIFDERKIRVVENGVDVARFARARDEFEGGRDAAAGAPLRVGIVGELSALKGQEEFVRAAAVVAGRSGGRVEFVIAGEDSARGRPRRALMERLVTELNLDGRVRLLGQVGEEEMPRLMASLDVFVSASHSEAFGVAMVEALACGVPVVATATDGAREIVEEGVTGLLVPVGDVNALASSISSLLEDEARRKAFGAGALAAARRRFDVARMVESTERVYAESLAER
ncbi:MAG TPA: glycosyltransferase family 4 protein [Pyrinomonadaceae bacterium]|jgi:glycosyltransferase involved in cell wall biosynthesis